MDDVGGVLIRLCDAGAGRVLSPNSTRRLVSTLMSEINGKQDLGQSDPGADVDMPVPNPDAPAAEPEL